MDRDIKPTTHALNSIVNDMNEAKNMYDSISYKKGACMLK
jgi:aminopeptidase N